MDSTTLRSLEGLINQADLSPLVVRLARQVVRNHLVRGVLRVYSG